MELRQLRHFLEIVRHASFGQASKALSLTQPALSKSIKNLEEELGVQLLQRTGFGAVPTVYGQTLLQYAGHVSGEMERAIEEINELRGAGRGIVRIGTGPSLIRSIIAAAVRDFAAEYPKTRVIVVEGLKEPLYAALRRAEIDFAVTTVADPGEPDIMHEAFAREKIMIVAARDHPLAGKPGLSIADLADFEWVIPSHSEPEREKLRSLFEYEGLLPPMPRIEGTSATFMLSLLPGTTYLSYLPSGLLGAISREESVAPVVALDLQQGPWERTLGVSYRRGGVMLHTTRALMTAVKRKAQSLLPDTAS